jgi:hypothetical protein
MIAGQFSIRCPHCLASGKVLAWGEIAAAITASRQALNSAANVEMDARPSRYQRSSA